MKSFTQNGLYTLLHPQVTDAVNYTLSYEGTSLRVEKYLGKLKIEINHFGDAGETQKTVDENLEHITGSHDLIKAIRHNCTQIVTAGSYENVWQMKAILTEPLT